MVNNTDLVAPEGEYIRINIDIKREEEKRFFREINAKLKKIKS